VNWQSVEWSISAIFLWVTREQHHLRTIRQSAPRRNLQWSRQPPGGRWRIMRCCLRFRNYWSEHQSKVDIGIPLWVLLAEQEYGLAR
jgi:hypothetical protein